MASHTAMQASLTRPMRMQLQQSRTLCGTSWLAGLSHMGAKELRHAVTEISTAASTPMLQLCSRLLVCLTS
jgi:hypothetical protein